MASKYVSRDDLAKAVRKLGLTVGTNDTRAVLQEKLDHPEKFKTETKPKGKAKGKATTKAPKKATKDTKAKGKAKAPAKADKPKKAPKMASKKASKPKAPAKAKETPQEETPKEDSAEVQKETWNDVANNVLVRDGKKVAWSLIRKEDSETRIAIGAFTDILERNCKSKYNKYGNVRPGWTKPDSWEETTIETRANPKGEPAYIVPMSKGHVSLTVEELGVLVKGLPKKDQAKLVKVIQG